MNKRFSRLLGCLITTLLLFAILGLFGCGQPPSSGDATSDADDVELAVLDDSAIKVISREEGSAARSAFIELFEIWEDGVDGQKIDSTVQSAVITDSTQVMLTMVVGDINAIGYVSLGSLDGTVKALDIEGVAATTDNVQTGLYEISRPFNVVTKGDISEQSQDYIDFIFSKKGQAIVTEDNYVAAENEPDSYKSSGAKGKIIVAGSSSVTPVMEKLKEAYVALNPDVTIEIQQSDSSSGISSVRDGACDIAVVSRELTSTEEDEGLEPQTIAIDGIAVIVNNARELAELDKDQVQAVFDGTIDNWKNL